MTGPQFLSLYAYALTNNGVESHIFCIVANVGSLHANWSDRYNERENLPLCIYMINKVMESRYSLLFNLTIYSGYSYEVIIVEDNSPDGTYEAALELQVGRASGIRNYF